MKGTEYLRGIYISSGLSIKPKNPPQQNRRTKRNHTRMGIKPRRNPNKRRPNETQPHNHRQQPTRKPAAGSTDCCSKTADAQRNPRKSA